MALINCPECKNEVSDKANGCPHCGYVIKAKGIKAYIFKNKKVTILLIVAIVLIMGVVTTGVVINNIAV